MKKLLLILLILTACTQTMPTQPQLKPITGPLPSGAATTQDGNTIAYQLYEAEPNSPGVILLHMLGRDRTDWDNFAKWLAENGYTVIAPDMRGHGQSTGDWEKYTAEDFNKITYDISAMKSALTARGADTTKLAIIGASIGANAAYNYAINDNDVKTIILLSPGLEYRGLKTSTAPYAKPFLMATSNDDQYSAQSAQQIKNYNPTARLIAYENAGHGTNMFIKPDLAPTILNWLQSHTYS